MQRRRGSRVIVAATPISAKSPRLRAISRKQVPVRGGSFGTAISVKSSSSRSAVDSAPVKNSRASIQRSPLSDRARIRAPSATMTDGNSDAGSA